MKWLLHYLTLVGLPILGIIGTLRLGETLTAPVAVAGTWTIEASASPVGDAACITALLHGAPLVLTISQSGPHLQLTFSDQAKTTLRGKLHSASASEATIKASAVGHATGSTAIEASVDEESPPRRLHGVLTTTSCSRRIEIPFTAARQPNPGQ